MSFSCAASGTLCGVELTDQGTYLTQSTQQTTDLLAQYDAVHTWNFPIFNTEFAVVFFVAE